MAISVMIKGKETVDKHMQRTLSNSITSTVCAWFLVCFATGCGAVRHDLTMDQGYQAKADTCVTVREVTNSTGETFDVDVEALLSGALSEKLDQKDLLCSGGGVVPLKIDAQIVDYKKGSAFQRWLLPGLGSTVLTVHCTLSEDDRIVGSAEAMRTVSIGGLYTVGAWRTIFDGVAKDIVADLRRQIRR